MRGDEAVNAVMHFIDDSILVGMSRVRILHGTGTGVLRQLIRQYLGTVPNVSHYRDEHVQFGGAGITVVDLDWILNSWLKSVYAHNFVKKAKEIWLTGWLSVPLHPIWENQENLMDSTALVTSVRLKYKDYGSKFEKDSFDPDGSDADRAYNLSWRWFKVHRQEH